VIGPMSLKPFSISVLISSTAFFKLSTVQRTALKTSEMRFVPTEQSFSCEPEEEILPKRSSTVGSILLIKLIAFVAFGGSGLSMYDRITGTRRIIWLWIMLALELTSVPEGSNVVVAVIGIGDVISPPDITGTTSVVTPEGPLCTTVAVITEGPKSEDAPELVEVVIPEFDPEELLLVFMMLEELLPVVEDLDEDAESLDELDELDTLDELDELAELDELEELDNKPDKDVVCPDEEGRITEELTDELGVVLMRLLEELELEFLVVAIVLDRVRFQEMLTLVCAVDV
jgi:hypothetical protein